MNTLIVTDIFGKTQALIELASAINKEAIIIDPYMGKDMGFNSEREAYEFFTANIGLGNYTNRLNEYLASLTTPTTLIGFSVGAAAIWNTSDNTEVKNITRAICFYGSQIRYNPNITPLFPLDLVFPATEKHFSVKDLMDTLKDTQNISIRHVSYLHGFMNKLSDNFDQQGCNSELQILKQSTSA